MNRYRTVVPVLLFILVAGCGREDAGNSDPHDEHDHAHVKPAATQPEKHDHDHDHEHSASDSHGDEVKLSADAIGRNGIRIAQAKSQVLTGVITAPGRVAYDAERVAHVSSVVSGRVAEIKVRIGEQVKKDDVLLVVDSTELGEAQSEFLQKRTSVETAGPAVELARSAYERASQLFEKQGISLTEVQKRQGELQAAQGALAAAQAAARAAENRLQLLGMSKPDIDKLTKDGQINPTHFVRAPIEGRIIDREVPLGELVGPDKDQLMVIADLRNVWVIADVPESVLSQIALQAKASVVVPALRDTAVEGVVSYIAPELDASTRTARVRTDVSNPEQKLLPGMFARVEIATGAADAPAVVVVPEDAVQNIEGKPSVFVPVEGEANTFAVRPVSVGQAVNGLVPVAAGLKEGDAFVASGSFILKADLGKAGAAHEH